jgi:curved DNA-binding protein CbpA
VLGIAPGATAEEIRAAYRKLVLRWHPDRHFGDPEMQRTALEKTQEINAAYAALNGEIRKEKGEGAPARKGGRFAFPSEFAPERPLNSRTIASVGYDDRFRLLYVKFRKGAVYVYHDVPRPVYEGLLAARSHERYADEHLFGSYPFTRF